MKSETILEYAAFDGMGACAVVLAIIFGSSLRNYWVVQDLGILWFSAFWITLFAGSTGVTIILHLLIWGSGDEY